MLNTLRYLKPVQVYTRYWRGRPQVKGMAPQRRPSSGAWQPPIARPNLQIKQNHFCFLNQEHEIHSWNDSHIPKLWLYNLHYMDHPSTEFIERWIEGNPGAEGNGWEPYPLSLRIVNWVKWSLSGQAPSPQALRSLAEQARVLAQSIEYHLQGNHLFVNFKALVFAGAFFSGAEAAGWLRTGLKGLAEQVREQILTDGGHFERSPMYHALILEDLLDLINLSAVYPDVAAPWRDTAGRMLGWLESMCHPDGEISFFNDAAFGIAPQPRELSEYAARLGIEPKCEQLAESGYVRLENPEAGVIFDAAAIGPDYQPGHAHADTLSFELSVCGKRVLVNSGTSTYENSDERQQQRGTAAHNTIRIDGEDQSEMWSAFRVARRARPKDVQTDHRSFAQAAHTGYLRLKDPVLHTRRVELRDDSLLISDLLEGRKAHRVELFFHCHPEAYITVEMDSQLVQSVEDTQWYPEFNRAVPNKTIVGRWFGQLPVRFETRIPFR